VVTAGQLAARSPLRKLFESHRLAHCAAVYNDPPDRDEIDAALKAAGLTRIEADALAALTGLARVLDGGDFRQTLEKIALYKLGDDNPLTADEVALSAPASLEAELDDVIGVVADGQPERIGPLLARLYAQGTGPVAICIGATRHFRLLHAVASDAGGPSAGIGRVRPPVFGPRRDLVLRQASNWGTARLERALTELTDTDLQLRSADRAPQQALVERALIRLAMLGQRR
jgi:DNA polymerase-3 subunit delta